MIRALLRRYYINITAGKDDRMSKPFDEEDDDFEPLKIDEEFEDVWGGEEDDFVDISLDGGSEKEDKSHDRVAASSRPVRKIEKVIPDPFAEEEKGDSDRYPSGWDSSGNYSGGSRGQGGGHFSGHKSYIILALICLVVVAAVVVILKFSSGKAGAGETTAASTGSDTSTEASVSAWKENGNEAVTQLVNQYYTALKAADMTTLQNIMDAGSMPTEDTVSKMNGYIEDYQNISCYTMDGEKEGEYALYIAYDAKFKDVNTLAPGLTPAYVVTDSAGALRLMTVEQIQADERIVSYMNQVSNDEKIEQLGKDILNRFNEALAADPALNALVGNGSEGTTAAGDSQPAESTSQPESTTPAESSTQETTTAPAETSPAETTTTAAQGGENTFTEQTTGMVFQNTDTMMYTNNQVKARKAPTTDGEDFDIVSAGTKVHVIGKSDSWYRVYLPEGDGSPRYIRSDLLVLDNPAGGN